MGAAAVAIPFAAYGATQFALDNQNEIGHIFKSDNPFQNISETRLRDFQKKFDNEKHLNKVQFRKYWSQEDEFSDEQINATVSIFCACIIFIIFYNICLF